MKSYYNRIIPMLAALLAISLPANSLAISRGTNTSDPEGRRKVATMTDQQQSPIDRQGGEDAAAAQAASSRRWCRGWFSCRSHQKPS